MTAPSLHLAFLLLTGSPPTDPPVPAGPGSTPASPVSTPGTEAKGSADGGEDRSEDQDEVQLGTTVVTATGSARDPLVLPIATSVLDRDERLRRQPGTVPDSLVEEVGVVIQKTNLGGGSPLIRGRSGKDVLELIDGFRFNNSTFRRNHQYLNTIGMGPVDRIEIVRGPASVLYGSDALGGAIDVITLRNDPWSGPDQEARVFTQYQSAARAMTGELTVSVQEGDFGLIGGVGMQDIDDLRAGEHGDPAGAVDTHGRQVPTGYRGNDAWAALTHRITEEDRLDFFWFQGQQYDVPRTDVIIPNDKEPDPPDLRRDSDPQILRWYSARFQHRAPGETLEEFTLTATLNDQEETRRRVRVSSPTVQRQEHDRSFAPGLKTQFVLRPAEEHTLTTGAEATFESLDSARHDLDLTSGSRTSAQSRFPDDSVYQSYGIYAQDEWELADGLRWTNGVRYSIVQVHGDLENLVVGPAGPFGHFEEIYQDLTFATGLSYEWRPNTWVYGSISKGFRAPNLDDLAVLGDFAVGERVPNFDVDPEKVWNFEIGAQHRDAKLRAGAVAALALYEDLLDQSFAFSIGADDFFQITNRSRARILSFESWVEQVVATSGAGDVETVVFANAFGSWGRDTSTDDPVSKVPPAQGLLGLRVAETGGDWFAEIFGRGAVKQDRLSDSDRADPRFPEGGTPAWATLNVRAGKALRENLQGFVALENVLDRRYRVHGSGVDAPGTNLILQLDWRF